MLSLIFVIFYRPTTKMLIRQELINIIINILINNTKNCYYWLSSNENKNYSTVSILWKTRTENISNILYWYLSLILTKLFTKKDQIISPAGGAVRSLRPGWSSSGLQHQNSARQAGVKTSYGPQTSQIRVELTLTVDLCLHWSDAICLTYSCKMTVQCLLQRSSTMLYIYTCELVCLQQVLWEPHI